MKYLSVYLMAAALSSLTTVGTFAQTPALQRGVSVQMAVSKSAVPMPDADKRDAWIVAVTADGQIYFGTQAVTSKGLAEEMIARPRKRTAKLYIKSDARVPYTSVKETLAVAKTDLFDDAVLLTNQPQTAPMGTLVPPNGLEVMLTAKLGSAPVAVQVLKSGQKTPQLKINNNEISAANLQSALNQALQNQSEKIVAVNADGQLPFSQVVQVIDACHSVGAKVVLPAPEL